MVRSEKTVLAKLLSLLVAVTLCLTVFTVPVSAKASNGNLKQKDKQPKITYLEGVNTEEVPPPKENLVPIYDEETGRWDRVHTNPATYEKNYILSPEQKEYSIKKYKAVVTAILEPEMSDLEKYYTLAIWLNHHVNYDWDFWSGGYDFDYYSHQWDAYGVLKERKSVCAGIAVAFANLCHAADLPCKFIKMAPYWQDDTTVGYLDHTINYIPNINDHAYYIDVTEDFFFMSATANPWNPIDLEFSHIPETQIPDDGSFEIVEGTNTHHPSSIKEHYGTPFDVWFKKYALHENSKKKWGNDYINKGSSTPGIHYASYKDYPKQFSDTEKPGLWFLEDFYKDPETIRSKILNKEFDEQLLNISGIQGSYDCNTAEDLVTAVSGDIAIKYFPSSKKGNVVAEAADLTNLTDYRVSCDPDDFNLETGEATITIAGAGEYSGEYQISVKLNSAAVTKAPANKMDLVYTGEPQTLVEPGEATNGKILYAWYNKVGENESWKEGNPDAAPYPEPDLVYSEEIPTATDSGRYAVWYKIEGDETHSDAQPQRLERVAVISRFQPEIHVDNLTVKAGEKVKLTPTINTEKAVTYDYLSLNDDVAKVSRNGIVKGVATGTATICITGTLKGNDPNYEDPEDVEIKVKVVKGKNPIKLGARTVTVKYSKLKKKAQTIKRAKLITVSKAQGKLTYKLVSAKKGKTSFNKYFKVNSKNGNVTVKKGLKKGTYKVKVKVKAAGNRNYNPSSWKNVTSKVLVK